MSATLIRLSYVLMLLNVVGGVILLKCLHNGHRPHLAGIRWMLRVLASIPLAGLTLNLIQASGLISMQALSPIRVCIGYTMIGVAVWGFVLWLHRK